MGASSSSQENLTTAGSAAAPGEKVTSEGTAAIGEKSTQQVRLNILTSKAAIK